LKLQSDEEDNLMMNPKPRFHINNQANVLTRDGYNPEDEVRLHNVYNKTPSESMSSEDENMVTMSAYAERYKQETSDISQISPYSLIASRNSENRIPNNNDLPL